MNHFYNRVLQFRLSHFSLECCCTFHLSAHTLHIFHTSRWIRLCFTLLKTTSVPSDGLRSVSAAPVDLWALFTTSCGVWINTAGLPALMMSANTSRKTQLKSLQIELWIKVLRRGGTGDRSAPVSVTRCSLSLWASVIGCVFLLSEAISWQIVICGVYVMPP